MKWLTFVRYVILPSETLIVQGSSSSKWASPPYCGKNACAKVCPFPSNGLLSPCHDRANLMSMSTVPDFFQVKVRGVTVDQACNSEGHQWLIAAWLCQERVATRNKADQQRTMETYADSTPHARAHTFEITVIHKWKRLLHQNRYMIWTMLQ